MPQGPCNDRRWACPFYKKNPRLCRSDSCRKGFTKFSLYKSHLYQNHSPCQRCGETFETKKLKLEHSKQSCLVSANLPANGITPEKDAQLRQHMPGVEQDEKWRQVYRILFPNEPVPSPYVDDDETSNSAYQRFLLQNLSSIIQNNAPQFTGQNLDHIVAQALENAGDAFNNNTPMEPVEQQRDSSSSVIASSSAEVQSTHTTLPATDSVDFDQIWADWV